MADFADERGALIARRRPEPNGRASKVSGDGASSP